MVDIPERFTLYNEQQTKRLVIVIKIDGVPGLLTSSPIGTRVRYGDGTLYGDPGIVYGGLRPLTMSNGGEVRSIISLEGSSLTLSQKIEPEQGRGSVSTLSFQLIDKNKYITQLFSSGIIVEEILNRGVTVYLGYSEISYPEDFHQIFRGRISQVAGGEGFGVMQLSDPNIGRRQNIFYSAKTTLAAGISSGATTVTVNANTDFHRPILGPNGAYDQAVKVYLKIEDEFIEYGPSFSVPAGTFGSNTWTGVVRGTRGTTAAAHPIDSDVEAWIQLEDHAIDMALKIMLSGWNGVWTSGVEIDAVVQTGDIILGAQPTAYILPDGVDAVRDYNIQPGDYLTFSGCTTAANNGTFTVTSFADLSDQANRIIYTSNVAAVAELASPGVFAIRSQYDTYPTTAATQLGPLDVDISRHLYIKNTFLGVGNDLRFLIGSSQSAKTFIESEIYMAAGMYGLSRMGQLSAGYTSPPLVTGTLPFIDQDNVLNAPQVKPVRGLNNRKFFNEIVWSYDANDDGKFRSIFRQLDTDSLNRIGLSSVLPINSLGMHSDLDAETQVVRRSSFLLSRYKNAAVMISIMVNYGTGVVIEAGDVVALEDDGNLQIQNWQTGDRNLGTQLFEVIERTLDLRNGNITLTLIAGLGADVTDRFGTIAPSSRVVSGSTTTEIIIQDSYGALFPGNEKAKWEDYVGLPVIVHSDDWTAQDTVTLLGFDPVNPYKMLVEPLAFVPTAGYIVEIDEYPTTSDPFDNQLYKAVHCFLNPTVDVVTGVSNTVFTVAPGDIAKFKVGAIVLVHEPEWSYESTEVRVDDVDTGLNQVTVGTSLGFVPAVGDQVEFIGYADGGGGYRFI